MLGALPVGLGLAPRLARLTPAPAACAPCPRSVKDEKQRYLTATSKFNRGNNLQPHDVLWLQAGAPLGKQLLFGVWRWGSQVGSTSSAGWRLRMCMP